MNRWLLRTLSTGGAFVVTYYVVVVLLGYGYHLAALHGFVRSERDTGRAFLWALAAAVVLAALVAGLVFRRSRLWQVSPKADRPT